MISVVDACARLYPASSCGKVVTMTALLEQTEPVQSNRYEHFLAVCSCSWSPGATPRRLTSKPIIRDIISRFSLPNKTKNSDCHSTISELEAFSPLVLC
jgi:hypothetical protein